MHLYRWIRSKGWIRAGLDAGGDEGADVAETWAFSRLSADAGAAF